MYGVNTIKNVVIRDYTRWTSQGPQPIPVFDYLQMSGRAGRPGYDEEGFHILLPKLCLKQNNYNTSIFMGKLKQQTPVFWKIGTLFSGRSSQVASGMAKNPEELMDFSMTPSLASR